MKSFKDYEPSVQCDMCDKYLLIGDNPNNPILETCDDCIKKQKRIDTLNEEEQKEIIEELVLMITCDYWDLIPEHHQKIIEQRLQKLGL